jgi:type VI protein secretion system component Hcp
MANEIGTYTGMRDAWRTTFASSQPNTAQPGTTAGAGKVTVDPFVIKKTTDKASPLFFKNCCAGTHYKTVNIEMRKAGVDPGTSGKPFLVYKFGTVFTTK